MSLRHPDAPAEVATAAPTRLAAVLAAGQREAEATGGLFGKSDPLQTFRKAVTELDDKKAKEKLNKAVSKLGPAQSRALADEYAKAEAKAWEGVAKVATYEDYHKERKAKTSRISHVFWMWRGLEAVSILRRRASKVLGPWCAGSTPRLT